MKNKNNGKGNERIIFHISGIKPTHSSLEMEQVSYRDTELHWNGKPQDTIFRKTLFRE